MATEAYDSHHYDVIVIGAGGAGLRAAIEASAAGWARLPLARGVSGSQAWVCVHRQGNRVFTV